jgi:hypothetical protein
MTPSAVHTPTIPRIALQSVAGGLVLMAIFTCMWGSWATQGLMPAFGITVGVVFGLFAALFVVEAIRMLLAARAYPTHVIEERGNAESISAPRPTSGRWFGLIFAAEGLVIFVVCAILGATGNSDYINPAIALIVGVHFIPLAWVFQRTIDYYVAGWFVLAALAGIVGVAAGLMPVALAWSLVSIAAAAGTSFYGFYMIGVKRAMLATR